MKGPVLVCGNMVLDVLARPVSEPLAWNATTLIQSIEQHLGGNAASTSYTLGKLGVPVRMVSLCGNDAAAQVLRSRLASVGVSDEHIHACGAPTSTALALIHPNGERALYYVMGASGEYLPRSLPMEGCSHFHVAAPFRMQDVRKRSASLLMTARGLGLTTSIDTQWDTEDQWMKSLAPSLPHCDILFVNEREAGMLTGEHEFTDAARRLADCGPGVVVVKLGEHGCYLIVAGRGTRLPGYAAQPIDTTGAGDCFVGAFLASRYEGAGWVEAARFANAVGALAVAKVGATSGVLDASETRAFIRRQSSAD